MSALIVYDTTLTATTMDAVYAALAHKCATTKLGADSSIAIDLSGVTFFDPCGLACIWSVVAFLRQSFGRVEILLPTNPDVQAYLARMGFFAVEDDVVVLCNAVALPIAPTIASDVLLELTPIDQCNSSACVAGIILPRVAAILQQQLGYSDADVTNFSTTLSEACQNISDHSQSHGVAVVQSYHSREGAPFVTIGVADCGRGIRASLSERYKDAVDWDHGIAITQALKKRYSRFPDRGLGLYRIAQIVTRYQGRLHIRSGDTRICLRRNAITYRGSLFPGTQLSISLAEPVGVS